jgi:hypothetical protein
LTAGTVWESLVQSESEDIDAGTAIDKELKAASGYSKDMKQDLELYYFNNNESSRMESARRGRI